MSATGPGRKAKEQSLGSFNSMGLTRPVLRGISNAGYKDATPIQRRAIPPLLEGRDVVAMARTGSGKSAAFIIPLIERLAKQKVGFETPRTGPNAIRALIFSPTRELAFQTEKFVKSLSKFVKLKTALTLGGDPLDKQFSLLHDGPDVVVATPGRFLHLCIEMSLKLPNVEYVVFDEADRLFEMGLGEELNEIIARLPDSRQTCLFSATMPQMLADFASAGLNNPSLIRLDVESTLSDKLTTVFLSVRSQDKYGALLHLLKYHIQPSEMTVVFLPTRHHVDYVKEILERAQIPSTYVYSALDAEARKENIKKFKKGLVKVLLVTDVAARGIDIPVLDAVINFNFPHKPKLFVHRVGRVARAQRSGRAYSLVSVDDLPFLHALHVFLGKPIQISKTNEEYSLKSGIFGSISQDVIDEQNSSIERWKEIDLDLTSQARVASNAMLHYTRSIGAPSGESVKAMKEISKQTIPLHPIFKVIGEEGGENKDRDEMLAAIRGYKPTTTIFEIGEMKKSKIGAFSVMREKRAAHDRVVTRKEKQLVSGSVNKMEVVKTEEEHRGDFYLPYVAANHHKEKGLQLDKTANEITGAVMDMLGDDADRSKNKSTQLKWDRKKKKFAHTSDSNRKIVTESGARIPASYKSDLYARWKSAVKFDEDDEFGPIHVLPAQSRRGSKESKKTTPKNSRPVKHEFKSKDQILKERIKREKLASLEAARQSRKASRKDGMGGGGRGGGGGGGKFSKGKKRGRV